MCPVRPGAVVVVRRIAALAVAAQVHGHPLAAVRQFHAVLAEAHVDVFPDQRCRCGIVVTVNRHLVVEVHLRAQPAGKLIGLCRQGLQRRQIHAPVQFAPRLGALLERLCIELVAPLGDRCIELCEAGEAFVPECFQNVLRNPLDVRLDLRLVFRPPRSCREHTHSIVPCELEAGPVHSRFIEMGPGHARLQIVGHDGLRRAGKKRQRSHVRANPGFQVLSPARLGVRIRTRFQHRAEDLRIPRLAPWRAHPHRRPCVVDIHGFARPVDLCHGHLPPPPPLREEMTVLAVAVAVRMRVPVLLPCQPRRQVPALLHLLVKRCKVQVLPARVHRR